ncbi:MAG TPA: hypothetical protein V6D29_24685 [Leptolyngbyaceae cyanobacterium]
MNHNVIVQLEKVDEVLSVVGRFSADSFRANRLPLLKLPADILEALRQGKLEYTKARAIARIKDEEQRQALLQETIEQNLCWLRSRSVSKQQLLPQLVNLH